MKRTVTGCNVSFIGSNLTVHSSAGCAGLSHGAGTQPVSRPTAMNVPPPGRVIVTPMSAVRQPVLPTGTVSNMTARGPEATCNFQTGSQCGCDQ